MRTRVSWLMLFVSFLFRLEPAAADSPRFQTMDQYTRIQIPASAGSTFRLVSGKSGEVSVILDRVRPDSIVGTSGWGDGRVRGVQVKPLGLDKVELVVNLIEAGTESFAYLQGSTFVLDLWRQASPAQAKAAPSKPAPPKAVKAVAPAAAPTASSARSSRSARSPASEEPVIPAVDPLSKEQDLFQRFVLPMPELRVSASPGAFALPPKEDIEGLWKFSTGDSRTEAGKAFELAKKLYSQKNYGLALKTAEIIHRDFSSSPYLDELRLLEALCYRKLGEATGSEPLLQRSERALEGLAAERNSKGEPLPFHRALRLHFGLREFAKENWMQAIDHLEYVSAHGDPKENLDFPYVQALLAESYGKMSQPRRAERVYRFIVENYPKHVLGKEARFRIASLLGQERNYNRVIEEGEGAIKVYPKYEKRRPETVFQVAEAAFWTGDYGKAERFFRRFTEIASANTSAALAWVRLGELSELRKKDLKGARQAYLRAKNGYPFSQGGLVASVRLARIDLPVEKEPGFIIKNLGDMLADSTIDGDLRRMAELTLIDYHLVVGDADRAITTSRAGLAQTEGAAYEAYKRAYTRALFSKLESLNRQSRFADALALYEKEKKWFDLHGGASLRAISESYRGLGLYATSNEFMERYAKVAAPGRGLASAGQELTLARAKNSFARGAYMDALQGLPAGGGAEAQAMRAVSLYRTGRKREAYGAAERAMTAARNEAISGELASELAEIVIERSVTERNFGRLERDVAVLQKLSGIDEGRLAYVAADALWYQRKHQAAIAAYREALEKFPGGDRAERANYNIGMSLIGLGSRDAAVKQLTELSASSQSVWGESAKQELELMEWERKYSSVLRTLPPSGLGIAN
jgi:tetratricopeptide (TPR) repeat protein